MDSGWVQLQAGRGARLSVSFYKELTPSSGFGGLEPLTQRHVNIPSLSFHVLILLYVWMVCLPVYAPYGQMAVV